MIVDNPLTIESLARAIHEDELEAVVMHCKAMLRLKKNDSAGLMTYEDLPEDWKQVRREQARRMFERIMR